MKTYIAILRGINVSGHKLIKMEALRKMFENLNFKNIKTYIQSGNVLFQFKKTKSDKLEKMIVIKIREYFAFDVSVMVKGLDEIITVLENNPFVIKRKEDITKLHVTFLSGEPLDEAMEKIKSLQYQPDEFIVSGNVIYLFCPNGYGNTKLNNNFFENKLKLVATTRNWKTINELSNIGNDLPVH